ncbi:MAG: M50 family metallopeptidase [Rickettsiales bacterium]|jgi:regulator of sigma E protease|nr:M50 family metallopeptidase [Rickettsiales bacterium]
MMSIIGLIIVLGLVVFVHEVGHFLAARMCGVKVLAFSIGFGLGRPLYKWTDKRGTEWRIGWLPIGGYVDLYGEKPVASPATAAKKKKNVIPRQAKRDRGISAASLQSIPRWKRALIMSAGVIMNFVLAWIIFLFLFAAKPEQIVRPVIGTVAENSLAYNAGIKPGWTVKSVYGQPVNEFADIIKIKTRAGNAIVKIEFAGGETVRLIADKSWGIAPAADANPEFKKRTVAGVIARATREVAEQSTLLFTVIRQLLTGDRDSKQLGSFIMIAQMSGEALAAGLFALLSMIAMLSINLGVVNLLPIPALDGGHLLIIAIESITRRKLNEKAVSYVIMGGWAVLIALMALALKNDLLRVLGL